jgi:lipopolysaccharide/colanic/teichoic acid biosynthesis glycosyltransferase
MIKRLLDIIGALFGLAVFSPLLVFVAIWIKLDSKGPVFFRQERIGQYGRPFRIHKFRTMVTDAEARGLQLTTCGDRRITRSGCFLRKYKLDELAQLIDVLNGNMSLVGPRPEVPKYVTHYPADLKEIALSVKPGITDFASIEYRDENDILANSPDPERAYIEQVLPAKLKLHKRYASEQSFWLDIYLIAKTAMLVFGRCLPDMLHILGKLSRNQKRLIMLGFDTLALPLAFWSSLVLLEETFTPRIAPVWWMFFLIPLISIPIFINRGLYRAVIRYLEDRSLYTIFFAVTLSVPMIVFATFLTGHLEEIRKASFVIYWLIALLYIGGTRMLARSFYRKTRHHNEHKQRVIIYGAGEAGVRLATGLQAAGKKIPIAFVDDNPALQHHVVAGLKVYSPDELAVLIEYTKVDHILISIPSAPPEKKAEILAYLGNMPVDVQVIPGIGEILNSSPHTSHYPTKISYPTSVPCK